MKNERWEGRGDQPAEFVSGPKFPTKYRGMKIGYSEAIDAAKSIGLVANRNVEETERLRRMPPENIEAILNSGLMPLMRPATFGGYEGDWMTLIDCVSEVARFCGSTGWCMCFLLQHQVYLSFFPEDAQTTVYDAHPDPKVASSFMPTGTVKVVNGGFEVSGRWKFSSVIDYCDWVIVGGLVPADNGQPALRNFLLRSDQFKVERVWNSIGLKGTGSNDVIVEPTFVPCSFSYSQNDALEGRAPGATVHSGILYRSPLILNGGYAVLAPLHGIARGAFETFVDVTRDKINSMGGGKSSDNFDIQLNVGEAGAEIDVAYLLTEKTVATVFNGEDVTRDDYIRQRRDFIVIQRLLIKAVDRLFAMSGARGLAENAPLQRHWRDAHAISHHVMFTAPSVLTAGRAALGLGPAPNDFMVI